MSANATQAPTVMPHLGLYQREGALNQPDQWKLPPLTSPQEALSFWSSCLTPEMSGREREIYFAFSTSNHLRAHRVAEHLRHTSDCVVNILDHTTLDDTSDSWWVEGRTRPKVLSEDFVMSFFRWLSDAERKLGVRVCAISG
jgi:hypothetical protein